MDKIVITPSSFPSNTVTANLEHDMEENEGDKQLGRILLTEMTTNIDNNNDELRWRGVCMSKGRACVNWLDCIHCQGTNIPGLIWTCLSDIDMEGDGDCTRKVEIIEDDIDRGRGGEEWM